MLELILSLAPAVVDEVAAVSPIASTWQQIVQMAVLGILGLLSSAVTMMLVVLRGKLTAWIDAKAKTAGSEAHAAAFKCATDKLATLSRAAVDEVEQTLVRKLKREGVWTAATARDARDTAVEIMKRHAGEQGLAEMQGCLGVSADVLFGMFRTWVERQVVADGSSGKMSPIVAMGVGAAAASNDLDGAPGEPHAYDAADTSPEGLPVPKSE